MGTSKRNMKLCLCFAVLVIVIAVSTAVEHCTIADDCTILTCADTEHKACLNHACQCRDSQSSTSCEHSSECSYLTQHGCSSHSYRCHHHQCECDHHHGD